MLRKSKGREKDDKGVGGSYPDIATIGNPNLHGSGTGNVVNNTDRNSVKDCKKLFGIGIAVDCKQWRLIAGEESQTRSLVFRVVSLCIVITIAALYLVLTVNIPDVLGQVLDQSFGTAAGLSEFAILATPLFLTALAVSVPLRLGLWNVGGEGQFFAGAWLASGVAFGLSHMTGGLLIVFMLMAGAVGGGLCVAIPALAKAYLNVNEIITSLMLDLAIVYWVDYWISGPWHYNLSQGGVLESRFIPAGSWLPALPIDGGIDSGLLLSLGIVMVFGVALKYTKIGYTSRMAGSGLGLCRYAGMPIRKAVITAMLVAGGLAGIAGTLQLIAVSHQLTPALSNNTGYLGIAVAVLAGSSALGILIMGIAVAAVLAVGQVAQIYGVPAEGVFVLMGLLLLLSVLATVLSRYRLIRRIGISGQGAEKIRERGRSLISLGKDINEHEVGHDAEARAVRDAEGRSQVASRMVGKAEQVSGNE